MRKTSRPSELRRVATGAALAACALAAAAFGQRSNEPVDLRTYRRAPEAAQPFHGPEQWTAREVEHLLNRAAFGAREAEIQAWVAKGPQALVDHLLEAEDFAEPFYVARPRVSRELVRSLDPAEKRALFGRLREADRRQFHAFVSWWCQRMLRGDEPLRERMTLFWHGLFTSSMSAVKRSAPMIRQNELLREHALGSYATLLREILRDPAMLVYLDNDESRKEQPNENLARELLELFSLGEGNYTERDVQEAARALTGRTVERGEYVFDLEAHDRGTKQILGRRGRIGGNQLVDLILAQPACSRWIAQRLITWMEGVEPEPARLQAYADFLRDEGYAIAPFLRRLFLDPAFYRDEVVGARVSSPVDYIVGSARRLGIEPPPAFVAAATRLLGQALLDPPSVKGWDEGTAWITTATLVQRGNLAGAMLGLIDPDALRGGADDGDLFALAEEDPSMSMLEMTGDEEGLLDEMTLDESGAMDDELGGLEMAVLDEPAETSDQTARELERELGSGRSSLARVVRALRKIGYQPAMHLTARLARAGARTDRAIAETLARELLAIEPPEETIAILTAEVTRGREELGVAEGRLFRRAVDPEPMLRRLAHLILSLPEAQLE